jgi:hypothetical protein
MAEVVGTIAFWIENTSVVSNVQQALCHDILITFKPYLSKVALDWAIANAVSNILSLYFTY